MHYKKFISRIFINKNITALFSGQLISQMGDSMFLIGLMWLVLDMTGSKAIMGTVAMISHIPIIIFSLFAGVFVDTYNRKKIMLIADLGRAIIILIIPVSYFLNVISIPIIIFTAVILSTFASAFNPARDSIVPFLVDGENLIRTNSLIQVSNYIAILLGPALAAALISIIGVAHLFTIDSVTFIISFLSILFISYSSSISIKVDSPKIVGQLKEIIKYINTEKRIRYLLLLTAINNFFIMGPAIVGIPIFVKEVLHKGASSYALVESSYGLGMLVGVVLINYLTKFLKTGVILLIGMIFDGITFSIIYFTQSLEIMILLISFHAIGIPFIVVARTSLIQKWVTNEKLGRTFSFVNMAVVGMTALTSGVTGLLAEYITIQEVFAIFGTAGMLCGISGLFYKQLRNG